MPIGTSILLNLMMIMQFYLTMLYYKSSNYSLAFSIVNMLTSW